MAHLLMKHSTAVWMVENTALTFQQIADFCGLHVLEVQAMADETSATRYIGRDPVRAGELTLAEIERCQKDPTARLQLAKGPVPQQARTKGPRYTPVSKRQDKPDGIAWLIRYHPELSDGQISKLIGTTKTTIGAIRDRSHWNIQNIKPQDPVALGLCSQRELDALVARAAKKRGDEPVESSAEDFDTDRLEEQLKLERAARGYGVSNDEE